MMVSYRLSFPYEPCRVIVLGYVEGKDSIVNVQRIDTGETGSVGVYSLFEPRVEAGLLEIQGVLF